MELVLFLTMALTLMMTVMAMICCLMTGTSWVLRLTMTTVSTKITKYYTSMYGLSVPSLSWQTVVLHDEKTGASSVHVSNIAGVLCWSGRFHSPSILILQRTCFD